MIDEIQRIRDEATEAIAAAPDLEALGDLQRSILAKSAPLGQLKKGLGALDADARRAAGQAMNEATQAIAG
ncbi:MAG: hypothetical protein KDA94_09015, partial [Acidimicrobiales bacterium]|nr:hypothetical protein [Acidimicrobiales bacterium]